jgi:hypothetical protein
LGSIETSHLRAPVAGSGATSATICVRDTIGQRNRADLVTVVDDNSPRGQQRLGGVLGCERWIGEQARRRELELVAP